MSRRSSLCIGGHKTRLECGDQGLGHYERGLMWEDPKPRRALMEVGGREQFTLQYRLVDSGS